jgi:hypothetical protein
MDERNSIRVIAAVNALAEFYGESLSDIRLELYVGALEDLTADQVEQAAKLAIKTSRFFPKPVELIELVKGSNSDIAEQAWQIAWNAYLRAGYWHSVLFQDGAIARALMIVFGGWVQFSEASRQLSPEMMQAKRKEFLTTYRRESRKAKEPMRLAGHHEIENLNTVSTWTRDQFSDTYKQGIFIAQESGSRFVEATFHRNSAQMIETDLQLLEAASMPILPAPKREPLQLTPKPSEAAQQMKTEEIQAQVQALIKSVKMKN